MIAAALIVRDEALRLPEWLAYHYGIGITKFVVYNHQSWDDTAFVLRRLQSRYNIDIVPWPTFPSKHTQFYAYRDACFRLRPQREVEWCAFIDIDEFLLSTTGNPVQQLVDRCQHASAIALHWAVFGPGPHVDGRVRPNGLVIEEFVRRAPLQDRVNGPVKSLVRPSAVLDVLNPHAFFVDGQTVDGHGHPFTFNAAQNGSANPVNVCDWRINHYATRGRWHWEQRLARGQLGNETRNQTRWEMWNRNEQIDISAQRFFAAAVHAELRQQTADIIATRRPTVPVG